MVRKKGAWDKGDYETTAREIREREVSVTEVGEQRTQQGLGLHPLVDPRTHDVTRSSLNLLIPQLDGTFILRDGVAMPKRNVLDTTGSMQPYVGHAFKALPRAQQLIVQGRRPVLARYHVQDATVVIQDIGDQHPHQHSEHEPDNEVERQMRLMSPEGAGGDPAEDYQLDLWYAALRVETSINRYGLMGYNFMIVDQVGRDVLTPAMVRQVYGIDALQSDISTRELGRLVLEKWHTFALLVVSYPALWWENVLGPEYVIYLPETSDIPEIEAVIIGLTEGVFDLQSAVDYLQEEGVSLEQARRVVQAVSHIPLLAQANLPKFRRIPPKGSVFASRDDLWPIGHTDAAEGPRPTPPGEITWQL